MNYEKENESKGQEHKEKTLPFFINDREFHFHEQYITGAEIRRLGDIPSDWTILLAVDRPWEDEIIENDSRVDLAREGKEHFLALPPHHKVEISIDGNPYKVKRGKHTVAQLKEIGHVPAEYVLEELVEGKLDPLKDNATVHIKGGEVFISHVKDGTSS